MRNTLITIVIQNFLLVLIEDIRECTLYRGDTIGVTGGQARSHLPYLYLMVVSL